MNILRILVLFSWLISAVLSANPFTDEVDKAQPDAVELEQAQKQIEQPLPEEITEPLFVPSFHQYADKPGLPATLCLSCHSDAVHRKSPRKRAFLNMHARIIACETCHWKPEEKTLEYRWKKVEGSGHDKGMIIPWLGKKPVITMKNEPWAHKLKQDWDKASDAEKVKIKARLHHPLKQTGPGCGACHRHEDNLLNMQALDYQPGRVRELELNPTARFIERTEPQSEDEPVQRLHLRDLLE